MKQEVLSSILIKSLTTIEELTQVRQLEAQVWSADDTVPLSHTIATIKNGGLILGAYYKDELIGFQYSFPGFDGNKVYLVSHSLGIHPNYRKLGIGKQLKLAQRKAALKKGYDLLRWTYDPLETVNANLNLHKLRAVCTAYIENAYGDMPDGMNAGIPSDRFSVDWRIGVQSQSSSKRESFEEHHLLISTDIQDGLLAPMDIHLDQTSEQLLVPVPANFQDIKKINVELALRWREKTRVIFKHYLDQGWIVTDLLKDPNVHNQYVYLLEKQQ